MGKNKNIIITLCIIAALICLVSTITLALHMSFIIVFRYWWAFLVGTILSGSVLIFCVVLYISDLIGRKKRKDMTTKEKKEYLKRYKKIDSEINQLLLEKQEIMALGTKVTPTYSTTPKGAGEGAKIQSVIEKLEEQEIKIDKKIDELCEFKGDIEKSIHTVEDDTLRVLLRYRYINGLTWEAIAVRMHYSWRQIIRLHGIALDVIVCHS